MYAQAEQSTDFFYTADAKTQVIFWKQFKLMLSVPAVNSANLSEIYNSLKSKLEEYSLTATSAMKALQQHELHRQFDTIRVTLSFDSAFNLVDQSGFFFPSSE